MPQESEILPKNMAFKEIQHMRKGEHFLLEKAITETNKFSNMTYRALY